MPYKNIEVSPTQYNSSFKKKTSQFYKGYSSVNYDVLGTTLLYDVDLVKQDLINQFNTRQGERVMLPTYGTIIWSIIFEPFTDDIKQAIIDDITKIVNSDPRVIPTQININEQEYGILLEVSLQIVNSDQSFNMSVSFDKELGYISQ